MGTRGKLGSRVLAQVRISEQLTRARVFRLPCWWWQFRWWKSRQLRLWLPPRHPSLSFPAPLPPLATPRTFLRGWCWCPRSGECRFRSRRRHFRYWPRNWSAGGILLQCRSLCPEMGILYDPNSFTTCGKEFHAFRVVHIICVLLEYNSRGNFGQTWRQNYIAEIASFFVNSG